jgi:lysine 2,3-aminomutase
MKKTNPKKPGIIASFGSLKQWAEDEKGIRINARVADVIRQYPMKVNEYYRSLIETEGDPIWKQSIPDPRELRKYANLEEDPLSEEKYSPIELIVHRYPDRALLLVSNECAMYCRFCTRKRKIGNPRRNPTLSQIDRAIDYITKFNTEKADSPKPKIRDVLISGGDPLSLSNSRLEHILDSLRKVSGLEILRIGTRIPVTDPMRITEDRHLVEMLRKYRDEPPLYINTHFNHPREITPESRLACRLLADAGIPLGNQTVLMRGVNDEPETMKQLVQGLLTMRVRPYYLYMPDLVEGTGHFQVTIQTGLKVIEHLRGYTTGLAVPLLMIDGPGGKGKTPVMPDYVQRLSDSGAMMKNYRGEEFIYPNPRQDEVGENDRK